jgi:stage II sporulation protein M
LLCSVILVSAGALAGSWLANERQRTHPLPLPPELAQSRDLCRVEPPPPAWGKALAILGQNSLVLLNLVLGALTLGLRTVSQLLRFGFEAGGHYEIAASVSRSHAFAIAALMTHGVFEIPAFLLGGSAGLRGALLFLAVLRRRADDVRGTLRQMAWTCAVAAGLLVAAALVEEFITPVVIRQVLGCT